MTTPRRNDPCPCGSGQRYKNCCGALATVPAAASPSFAPPGRGPTLQEAVALHQGGDTVGAETAYRALLEVSPDDINALHLLGLLLAQKGEPFAAEPYLRRAAALGPQLAEIHLNFGNVLQELRRGEEALACYQRALECNPALAEAHYNLGKLHFSSGYFHGAAKAFSEALRLRPGLLDARLQLAEALGQLGRLDEGRGLLEEAVEEAPARVLLALGQLEEQAGNANGARESYEKALVREPDDIATLFSLALLLVRHGLTDQGATLYQRLLHLDPGHGSAWVNLGNLFRQLAQFDTALHCYRQAWLIKRGYESQFNIVTTLGEAFEQLEEDNDGLLALPAPQVAVPFISVVTCSVEPERTRHIESHLREVLAGCDFEIIVISDATGLAEGYNRGLARAKGEIIVFCHDDIEIVSPDFPQRLASHLQEADMLGVAGTSELIGPIWTQKAYPYLHGVVAYPWQDNWHLVVYGASRELVPAQAVDGLFIACRRQVAEALGFDQETFDGFHLYDLDFSHRAWRAGYRLRVSSDIVLSHLSHGDFGDEWRRYAERFCAKFGFAGIHDSVGTSPGAVFASRHAIWGYLNHLLFWQERNLAPLPTVEEEALRRDILGREVESYPHWLSRYAPEGETALAELRCQAEGFVHRPLISLVMPVYNSEERWLRAAIDSVLAQTWPHWELCIADDASSAPWVRPLLQAYADADPRVRIVFRTENGHISVASNSALELAVGDWIALLDHDDRLPPFALHYVAEAIQNHPDAGIFYSDEDKIDVENNRFSPYFKPDWNPGLFLSHNLISHLGVYRADLIRRVGGFRQGYEGSQDHDLALRVSELLAPEQIVHIPRVLYNWRTVAGSTAVAGDEKNYAIRAAVRAINDALARRGLDAEAAESSMLPNTVRVRYRPPPAAPLASIIIPTRNGLELLRQCVESIQAKTRYRPYEILVVDNGSDDTDTLAWLAAQAAEGTIRLRRDDGPFNYSALNNRAVEEARGEILVLLNNDIEILEEDWLEELVSQALRPEVGAVGTLLLYPDGNIQHAGVVIGPGGVAGHIYRTREPASGGYMGRALVVQDYSAVTAACLATRKSVFHEVGGLNEERLAVAFNDIDYCLKLGQAGYRVVYTPFARAVHHESATRGFETTPEKRRRFEGEIAYMQQTWRTHQVLDPAHSPNLSFNLALPAPVFPPRLPEFGHRP